MRLWLRAQLRDGGPLLRWLMSAGRKLVLSVMAFFRNQLSDQVYSLSFSTMFAIVPIIAVLLAIARGFGFSDYMEQEVRAFLVSQPQVADVIMQFANNYLAHNQSYVIVGIGFVFMLYTVVSLFYNIEHAFNSIWQVKQGRSFSRILIDYTAMLLLLAVSVILTAGLTVIVGGYADKLMADWMLLPLTKMMGVLLQLAMLWLSFLFLYTFMPNTKVPLSCAAGPALLAAVLMEGFQYGYVWLQVALSSYNAIYGSVAILPLFMIWLMVVWYICLYGAQLSFVNEYGSTLRSFRMRVSDLSLRQQRMAQLLLLQTVMREGNAGRRPTLSSLAEGTGIPLRLVHEFMDRLMEAGLLYQTIEDNGQHGFAVGLNVAKMSEKEMSDRIEAWSVDGEALNL